MSGCRVFIGRLSPHARERDVEKFFKGYGRIREINLKNGFGFVVSVTDHFVRIMSSDPVLLFPLTKSSFFPFLLRNLMTIEMQMMLCTSWMAKNCVVKGKNLILNGSFVLWDTNKIRQNGRFVTKLLPSFGYQCDMIGYWPHIFIYYSLNIFTSFGVTLFDQLSSCIWLPWLSCFILRVQHFKELIRSHVCIATSSQCQSLLQLHLRVFSDATVL